MRIVLLGAPGSGKGTQAQRLIRENQMPQISTGDLLRGAVAKGSPLGLRAREAMDAGRLVDDEIVLGMIRERLAESDAAQSFILDGFPRNIKQAEALDTLLRELHKPLDIVVQMEVPYGELMRRISGRRTCSDCGRVFNVSDAASAEAAQQACSTTGAPHRLFQRPDDNEATVAQRLKVYESQTAPLIDYYRSRGLLQWVNAEGDVEEITRRVREVLARSAAPHPEQTPAADKPTSRSSDDATPKAEAGGRRKMPRRAALARRKTTARRKTAARKTAARKTAVRKTSGRRKSAIGAGAPGRRRTQARAAAASRRGGKTAGKSRASRSSPAGKSGKARASRRGRATRTLNRR